jgi:hypothetical protein
MVQDYVPAVVPAPGQIVSVILQMSTFGVLSICFSKSFKPSFIMSVAA